MWVDEGVWEDWGGVSTEGCVHATAGLLPLSHDILVSRTYAEFSHLLQKLINHSVLVIYHCMQELRGALLRMSTELTCFNTLKLKNMPPYHLKLQCP